MNVYSNKDESKIRDSKLSNINKEVRNDIGFAFLMLMYVHTTILTM